MRSENPDNAKLQARRPAGALGAENMRARERISGLKAEIEKLEPQAFDKRTEGGSAPDKSSSPITVSPVFVPNCKQKSIYVAPVADSSVSDVVITSSQELQVRKAVADSLRDRVDHLDKIKDGVQTLRAEINEKSARKDELSRLYEEKRAEIEYPVNEPSG